MRALLLTTMLLIASPTLAQDGQIAGSFAGQQIVHVFRTDSALLDVQALLDANAVNEAKQLATADAACTVATGQRAVTANPREPIIRVVVVSGEQAGCRGLIRREDFVPRR